MKNQATNLQFESPRHFSKISELQELVACKLLVNGLRPEISLNTIEEIAMFKKFINRCCLGFKHVKEEHLWTHVWERLKSPMEMRSFARYFFEGWMLKEDIIFGQLKPYSSQGIPDTVLDAILTKASEKIPQVADFGFGNLKTLKPWLLRGFHVSAFDMIPFCVEGAINEGIYSRVLRIDDYEEKFFEASEIKAETQDVVTTTLTLDRVGYPKRLLSNMISALKPKGVVLINTILPINPYDDAKSLERLIEYTPISERIVNGDSAENDYSAIVANLNRLSVYDVNHLSFPYTVESLDGFQTYNLWQIFGIKR